MRRNGDQICVLLFISKLILNYPQMLPTFFVSLCFSTITTKLATTKSSLVIYVFADIAILTRIW